MARPKNPPPDRRKDILEAALRVYSEKGYAAATNADIAREAGVTPAALYYYYPSKADLFKAAISDRRSMIEGSFDQIADQVLDLPPDQVLPLVVQAATALLSDERTLAIVRIVLSEGSRSPEVLEAYRTHVVAKLMPHVVQYLKRQMELGRVPEMDPRVFVILLASPIVATVILRDILKIDFLQDLGSETVARGITEITLPALLTPKKE